MNIYVAHLCTPMELAPWYTQQFLLCKYAQLYVGYMSYGGALIAHGP